MPVATTMPRALPYVTAVPLKAMLRWSARAVAATFGSASVTLPTGSDSPVSGASSIRSERRLDEAQVGGHDVALLEQHDVAGHDLAGRHEADIAAAHDARGWARHAA